MSAHLRLIRARWLWDGVARMDWQSVVAAGVAFASGTWAVWKFVSPFLAGSGGCSSCGGRHGSSDKSLLDIEKAPPA